MTQGSTRPDGRMIASIVLIVIVVVFALINLQPVEVSFLIFKIDLPLFLVLVVTGGIGFLAGMLVSGRRRP
ncbi:MAG: LapA family protein [Chloroflexota bacterium]